MTEFIDYYEYLESKDWQRQRRKILRYYDGKCAICNSTKELNVHHRTYERLGHENKNDLVVLCHACHEKFHEKMQDWERFVELPDLPKLPYYMSIDLRGFLVEKQIEIYHQIRSIVNKYSQSGENNLIEVIMANDLMDEFKFNSNKEISGRLRAMGFKW